MKKLFYVCNFLLLMNFSCPASNLDPDDPEEISAGEGDDSMEPEVYADVSKRAVDKAAAPNGVSAMIGIGTGTETHNASIKDSNTYTDHEMKKIFSGIIGGGYQKTLKHNIVTGLDAFVNFARKKKLDGSWESLNQAYSNKENKEGTKTSHFHTSSKTLSLEARLGYLLKKYRTTAFATLGMMQISGQYEYDLDAKRHFTVKVKSLVPTIGIGAEKKFSKKLGIRAEYCYPLKKNVTKSDHKIKMGKSDLRLLGVYNLGDL